jgi:hypothetical protein
VQTEEFEQVSHYDKGPAQEEHEVPELMNVVEGQEVTQVFAAEYQ